MTNDETGKQIFAYVSDGIKQGLRAHAAYYERNTQQRLHKKTLMEVEKTKLKLREPYHGKQTVSQLMQQRQQLNSIDISGDSSLRNFNKIAKQHGVDFAVKQNKNTGKYIIFFKAKDADVLASVFNEFSHKELNKNSKKESLLQKLNSHEKTLKDKQLRNEKSLPEKEVNTAEKLER